MPLRLHRLSNEVAMKRAESKSLKCFGVDFGSEAGRINYSVFSTASSNTR